MQAGGLSGRGLSGRGLSTPAFSGVLYACDEEIPSYSQVDAHGIAQMYFSKLPCLRPIFILVSSRFIPINCLIPGISYMEYIRYLMPHACVPCSFVVVHLVCVCGVFSVLFSWYFVYYHVLSEGGHAPVFCVQGVPTVPLKPLQKHFFRSLLG